MNKVAFDPRMAEETLPVEMEKATLADSNAESHGEKPTATIITVEEWDEQKTLSLSDKQALVLQIGSDWCERCPAMHDALAAMKTDFKFKWVYSDAADTELTDHFEVSKLPAVVMFKEGMDEPWVRQAASVTVVREAVKLMCPGVFVTDADF